MANPEPVIDAGGGGKDNIKAPIISAKKRSRSTNILRVAVFMLRRKSKSSAAAEANPKKSSEGGGGGGRKDGFWKNLMTAVRPLSIEDQLMRPASPRSPVVAAAQADPALMFHDLVPDIQSPFHDSSSCASSSVDPMSRYASAEDLKQLDDDDDDERNDRRHVVVVPGEGDQGIDLRAEEFIAKFYEQIRLQKLESVNDRSNRLEIHVEEMISTSTTTTTAT